MNPAGTVQYEWPGAPQRHQGCPEQVRRPRLFLLRHELSKTTAIRNKRYESLFPFFNWKFIVDDILGACRRHAAILALFIFILVATFRGTQHIFSLPSWTSSKHSECPSIRTNPHSILSPKVKDAAAIGKVWRDLHKIFDAHSPSPTTLPRPSHTQKPEKADLPSFLNISSQEALATRVQHAEVVRHLPLYPENLFQGRGIIMLAGGRYSDYAATALGMVREVGSKLPVEVWIKDKSEETKGWCAELEKEGMACRMLSDYMDMSLLPHAYQMKVFTMLFSTFQEFLFLDADDMPMSNPDVIFDGKMYKEKGAILWPDYWPHTGSPWLPYIMGISDKSSDMLADEQSVESGQVVWDKQRHWKVRHAPKDLLTAARIACEIIG